MIPLHEPDILIIGAGPSGCVVAERAASRGWSSLIVEKRTHIAGNCFDRIHESGVLIHQYGPHYFRTDREEIVKYLSKFTGWLEGNYICRSQVGERLYPFPINIRTLEKFFDRTMTPVEWEKFIREKALPISHPQNLEEKMLSLIGKDLYEAFYEKYTRKQWDADPRLLDPSIGIRIPVRFSFDERYVNHRYQLMPDLGYTAMFSKMLQHTKIAVALGTGYRDIKATVRPRVATVFCGPIDEYFDFRLGRLPWRSLTFDFQAKEQEFIQPCVQINYPDERRFTRSVEFKHVTKQVIERTVVSYEYPSSQGDPFYPVHGQASGALAKQYAELAERETREKRVFFCGRLANYAYINTDEAIEQALATFNKISGNNEISQANASI